MFQGSSWTALMADYSKNHEEGEAVQSELSSLCNQLSKYVEKKAAFFWHIDNFERYIREDINPYGLRIQIFPLIDNISPDFKKQWEDNLQACTRKMMRMLIEEYKTRSLALDKEIDNIYVKLQSFKSLPSLKEHEERIKIHLDQITTETLRKKDKKFWRDKLSFQEGRAYKWTQNNYTSNSKNRGLAKSTVECGSDSSINSSASASSFSRNRNRNRHNKPKRLLSGEGGNAHKKHIPDHPVDNASSTSQIPSNSGACIEDPHPPTGTPNSNIAPSAHTTGQLSQSSASAISRREVGQSRFFPQGAIPKPKT